MKTFFLKIAGKKLLGFAVGSWFKAAIAAAIFASFSFLLLEYNKGQKALVEVQILNAELIEQQETFKAEITASELENETLKVRHQQELSSIISKFEKREIRDNETDQNIIDLNKIDGADEQAPEFFQDLFK